MSIIVGETGRQVVARADDAARRWEDRGRRRRLLRLMVSQPRRLAAHALHNRAVDTGHGHLVGLRMGHGTRDDGKDAAVLYDGIFVRLASHCPDHFSRVTHLVIDECHDRSIDADVLCLLAGRLLSQHRHLRLVLMSATVHTTLFSEYFGESSASRRRRRRLCRCAPLPAHRTIPVRRRCAAVAARAAQAGGEEARRQVPQIRRRPPRRRAPRAPLSSRRRSRRRRSSSPCGSCALTPPSCQPHPTAKPAAAAARCSFSSPVWVRSRSSPRRSPTLRSTSSSRSTRSSRSRSSFRRSRRPRRA